MADGGTGWGHLRRAANRETGGHGMYTYMVHVHMVLGVARQIIACIVSVRHAKHS